MYLKIFWLKYGFDFMGRVVQHLSRTQYFFERMNSSLNNSTPKMQFQ